MAAVLADAWRSAMWSLKAAASDWMLYRWTAPAQDEDLLDKRSSQHRHVSSTQQYNTHHIAHHFVHEVVKIRAGTH